MRYWFLFAVLAGALCLFSGCQLVAAALRWAAGVAESPEAEATAGAVATSIGMGPLWGWLTALGTGAAAVFGAKKAREGGRLLTSVTGALESLKPGRTPEEKAVLSLVFRTINDVATQAGVDKKLDAFLAKRGLNAQPVLREAEAATTA